jgi:hypothetical protein
VSRCSGGTYADVECTASGIAVGADAGVDAGAGVLEGDFA